MLKLSIEEQKQILGGRYKAIIYDPSGDVYERAYFDSESSATSWAKGKTSHGGSYRIKKVK